MATTSGHEGIVKKDGNTIAEVIDFSFTQKTSPVEDTELSDEYKTFKTGGKKETDGSITCQWDVTDTAGQEEMIIDSEFELTLFPQGDASGDASWTGTAIITEVGFENSDGDTVKRSFTWIGSGPFVQSVV